MWTCGAYSLFFVVVENMKILANFLRIYVVIWTKLLPQSSNARHNIGHLINVATD